MANSLVVGSDEFRRLFPGVRRDTLDAMVRSFEVAVSYLTSADKSERAAALTILRYEWKRLEFLSPICERMAHQDADSDVRCIAVVFLGECYGNSCDRRVSKLLAASVSNQAEDLKFRSCAYTALVSVEARPDLLAPLANGDPFPVGVDWSLIQSLLSDLEPAPPKEWPWSIVLRFLGRKKPKRSG
jgi:hypothetical protein